MVEEGHSGHYLRLATPSIFFLSTQLNPLLAANPTRMSKIYAVARHSALTDAVDLNSQHLTSVYTILCGLRRKLSVVVAFAIIVIFSALVAMIVESPRRLRSNLRLLRSNQIAPPPLRAPHIDQNRDIGLPAQVRY